LSGISNVTFHFECGTYFCRIQYIVGRAVCYFRTLIDFIVQIFTSSGQ